jgi:hypothetical protein
MELRGNVTSRLKCVAYADDILLTTRTEQSLLDTFQKLKEISAQYRLIVNGQKTKYQYLRCRRKNYKLEELQTDLMYLEQVQSCKYLASTVNSENSIEDEIQCRITRGNKAYYGNQFFFKSRLVFKKSKLKLYWSIIRPIVTYACKVWVLKETTKNKLIVFERKVLRKIFGPTKERYGTWRIKTNDELIRHKNIINHIKAQFGLTHNECRKRE